MSIHRILLSAAILPLSIIPSAGGKDAPLRMKVLSAESYEFQAPPLAPPDCNWRDISAYCYSSSPETFVENTMVVQEPDGKRLEIGCTVYNRWSQCRTLPLNQSFDARRKKRSLEIRYVGQHGKKRKQIYAILR